MTPVIFLDDSLKRLLFLVSLFYCVSANAVPATVDYIIDGDTFGATVMMNDDIKIAVRVRIINIDTPEMSGECKREIELADAAKSRLAELIPVGGTVELASIKDDKYLGRIDANVITDAGDVGEILVSEKLARQYSGGKRAGWCK